MTYEESYHCKDCTVFRVCDKHFRRKYKPETYTGWDNWVKRVVKGTAFHIEDIFRSKYDSDDVRIKGMAGSMRSNDVFVEKEVLRSCSGDDFMSYVELGDKKGKNVMCDLDTIAIMMNRIKDLEDRLKSFD